MATGKIMRRNFAMKIGSSKEHSIFAKNTSEILNSSIQNSYKKNDFPSSFWNDLKQAKIASPREENRGPLRSMRSVLSSSKPTITEFAAAGGQIVNRPISSAVKRAFVPSEQSTDDEILPRALQNSAVATLSANRRLLRSSNGYKIISNRRFGSSASSSCGSLFRRHDDRRRMSSFKRTVGGGFMERLYNTQTSDINNSGLTSIASSKYLMALRNQNIPAPLGSISQAVQVSSAIQQELMQIDKPLRERISLKNSYPSKAATTEQQVKDTDPMAGWRHPPSPDMLTTRISERLSERRCNISKIENEKQEERTRLGGRMRKLTMTCVAPPENKSVLNKKAPLAQQTASTGTAATVAAAATTAATTAAAAATPTNDDCVNQEVDGPRKMMHMTARRMTSVQQQPMRRFSLRRPPTTNLTQITPPAPGPAAESIIQQHIRAGNTMPSRISPMSSLALNANLGRFSRFNGRPY